MPDQQLLKRFTARQEESAELAFAELVRRHGPLVLGACRQLLRDPHDAEDAFQATFLVLARRAGSIRRPERLAHWLYGVAFRVARKARSLNERRGRREGREVAMWDAEPIGDPGRHELRLIRGEEVEALHEELARLPEKYRLPVVLCDLGGLTHAEAAGRLRWPTGSLSVRLMRARELLRARLTRRGLAPTSALLATVALPETASAAVPPELAEATVRAALGCVRGHASTAGSVSASVSTLTGHVLTAMARPRLAAVTALVGGLMALMVGLLTLETRSRGDLPGGWGIDPGTVVRPDPQARTGRRRDLAGGAGAIVDDARVQSGATDDAPGRATRQGEGWKAAPEPPHGETLATYQDLVQRSGGDADAQVRLALWCEANDLTPERLKHLTRAVLTDPGHATARGLLGQVAFRGRWRRPEDLDELLRVDTHFSAALAEYDVRRDRMDDTADAHWRLALWCEQEGLEDEAWAHFAAVTRREPAREAAWRRLGYTRHRGRWMRPEQVDAEASALEAQRKADRHWNPLLARWKAALKEDSRRAWAEARLAGVTDPRAVPAIWEAFAGGGPDDQARATQLLGQLDGASATRALALLAVFGDSAEVRRVATETLARRDPRDAVGLLIDLLVPPIRYEVRPVQGPGAPGVLFVAGERFNVRRLYTVPPLPESTIRRLIDPTTPPDWTASIARTLGEDWARYVAMTTNRFWIQGNIRGVQRTLGRAARATLDAQRQLVNDIHLIEARNRVIAEANRRVEAPLRAITGEDHGPDREAWRAWWTDQLGYAYEPPRPTPRPTLDQEIPLPYNPGYSCFGPGTPVRTREGTRPIESIRVGDVVLTQEAETGALSFAPVLAVFHNKPAPTLRIDLGGAPIVATGIHRFWKAGRGWVMARDLKPGDAVRTLGGVARVSAVSADRVQPVFNLEVGESQSFFAGRSGALVHDNSPVRPVPHPFDEAPDLVARVTGDGID